MKKLFTYFTFLLLLCSSACFQQDGQFTELIQQTFSITPKCGMTDRVVSFVNSRETPLELVGIAMAPGTNGAGHFSVRGLQIGSQAEIPADVSGGINPIGEQAIMIQPGERYRLHLRYSPLQENTNAQDFHSSLVSMSFTEGIVQVELFGRSEGVADCPEPVEGVQTGLSGDVELTVTFMVAASGAIGVPITTDNGVEEFTPVTLDASITGTEFFFPQITPADNFFLPAIDPSLPGVGPLLSVLFGDTDVTTAQAINGTFDSQTGRLFLPNVQAVLQDEESVLHIDLDLTTDPVDSLDVPNDRLVAGGFQLVDGQIVGVPVQEDGTVHLVGVTLITEADGPLAAAVGSTLAVRIEAVILCPNGTTTCN